MITYFEIILFHGQEIGGLMRLDRFVDTWICGLKIVFYITDVNKYFIGILSLWIALPTKYKNAKWPMNKDDSHYLVLLKKTFQNIQLVGFWKYNVL